MQAHQLFEKDARLSDVERVKAESRGLYGSIAEELGRATDPFEKDATQVLKHHGTYQQDNRDRRPQRKRAGLGWEYKMMVRAKFPAGSLSAGQYLLCDLLCEKYGQGDLRVAAQ